MKKNFEEEIVKIVQDSQNKTSDEKSKLSSEDNNFLGAIDHLFLISQQAVDIYNSQSETPMLSTYKLPKEFLEMFLEIPGRRGGFCIISPYKLVILFDEDPDLITVIGKKRNLQSDTGNKTTQLLKVSFSKEGGEYKYKDNTGGQLDPYDMIALLTRWIVT